MATVISSVIASVRIPVIKVDGKDQGCEER